MGNSQKKPLSKIVSESLEKLAFMFFVPDSFRESIPFQNAVTAEVSFTGIFSGRLAVVMTEPALIELAANMLGIDNEEVDQNQLHDALKETANIICGNWLPVSRRRRGGVSHCCAKDSEPDTGRNCFDSPAAFCSGKNEC